MARITITLLNELTQIVEKEAKDRKQYLIDKIKPKTEKRKKELLDEKLKKHKLDKPLKAIEDLTAEINALENLQDQKKKVRRERYEDANKIIEKSEELSSICCSWWGDDISVDSVLRKLKEEAETEALYNDEEYGKAIKELDLILQNTRRDLLLSTSNAEVQEVVNKMLSTIDKLAKVD